MLKFNNGQGTAEQWILEFSIQSGYIRFQIAEVAEPIEMFAIILNRIDRLRLEAT